MLGKLAKWLKILGFDAVFFSKIEDKNLLELAEEEGRILLTRDNGLMEKARYIRALFIKSEDWWVQLGQVLDEFGLRGQVKPHSRCIECNMSLKDLSKARAKNLVTPYVLEHAVVFALCPGCGRVFWRGTHSKDMELKIDSLLKSQE